MNRLLKKSTVFLPLLLLSVFFIRAHIQEYRTGGLRGGTAIIVSMLLLYGWVIVDITRRRQDSILNMIVQSSFYIYIFVVLTLTGYFILFKEISASGWWHKLVHRIHDRERVNLVPFEMFRIYKPYDRQVLGNFIMLFPLGIYLPLLYRKFKGFVVVAFFILLLAGSIELMQLITSYRSADIDDVILNSIGAFLGFGVYKIAQALFKAE